MSQQTVVRRRRAASPRVPAQATARKRPQQAGPRHLTPAERVAAGKAARALVPLEAQGAFEPPADRADPVILLQRQSEPRVPELVPIRYGRMLASPFAYFRGAALPMAADLAATPVSGLRVQACGDAHLSNFGLFGSPERRLVFDINDFDETLPAPWEWDVKRLAASLEVAGRSNGFSGQERHRITSAAAASYRRAMRDLAGLGNLDVWYAHADLDELQQTMASRIPALQRKRLRKGIAKARSRDSMQAFSKLTQVVDGEVRIAADPPLVVPALDLVPENTTRAELKTLLRRLLRTYRRTLPASCRELFDQYEFADLARKVVGVGSVGTRCWIVLLLGRDTADPLFLQVKEAERSVLSEYSGATEAATEGERVVVGQQLMQQASDIFLGWERTTGFDGKRRDFYVRQLRDWKFSADIEIMPPAGMKLYAQQCGAALARAHARTGDRIAIAAYLGGSRGFEKAIAVFASAYADQNERDYAALSAAEASGRIRAERDI